MTKFNTAGQGYSKGSSFEKYNPRIPLSPYLALSIGGRIFDNNTPNFLIDFTASRRCNTMGSFDLTVCDLEDMNLEKLILDYVQEWDKRIMIQYGWYEGDKSPWYQGVIIDYKPSFLSNYGLTLTINGFFALKDSLNRIKTYRGKSITNIVEQVCEYEGWRPYLLAESEEFAEEREFVCSNIKSIDFIRESLCPEVISDTGFPYKFFLDCDSEGAKAYFVPQDYMRQDSNKAYSFLVNAGNFGSVIKFEPNYVGAAIKPFTKEAAYFNPDTGEVNIYTAESKNVKNSGIENERAEVVNYGTVTEDRMKALIQNQWFEKNIGAYTSSLEIVGDPDLMPLQYINIVPLRPNGRIHHTAGSYFISEIVDNVNSSYMTTINCIKTPEPTKSLFDDPNTLYLKEEGN